MQLPLVPRSSAVEIPTKAPSWGRESQAAEAMGRAAMGKTQGVLGTWPMVMQLT